MDGTCPRESFPSVSMYILSAAFQDGHSITDKNEWLDKHMPWVRQENRVFTPYQEKKTEYVPGGVNASDILIDDF